MEQQDREVARRIRDIIAVASDDIDAISVAVEDGVAYIEGVVSGESERRAILSAVRNVEGLDRVITCLAAEHILPMRPDDTHGAVPPPVLMHYYSLS